MKHKNYALLITVLTMFCIGCGSEDYSAESQEKEQFDMLTALTSSGSIPLVLPIDGGTAKKSCDLAGKEYLGSCCRTDAYGSTYRSNQPEFGFFLIAHEAGIPRDRRFFRLEGIGNQGTQDINQKVERASMARML